MIRSDAIAIVCDPDEQKRLTVTAGTESGSPARNAAMRATLGEVLTDEAFDRMITTTLRFSA